MPVYYFDTSALIKRYVQEKGTIWVTAITDRGAGNDLSTVSLTGPEMIATFFRKARGGTITRTQAIIIARNFDGYTSCTCPDCGVVRPKELWERGHTCECGAVYHRDTAAALVVLARGLANEVQAPAQELGQDKQVTRGLSCVRAAQADPLEAAGL